MEFFFHELDRNVLILAADGGLNMQTAGQFVGELEALVTAGVKRVIVDCSQLNFISSYGIGVLVRLHKRLAKQGGDIRFACVNSSILHMLTFLRMNTVFQIYPDVNQARLSLRPAE